MSFEPKKYKEIFDEMRSRTHLLTDFEVGSVTRTIYESFAYELALLYEKMNLVYLSAYVDTAKGFQLDQVVSILGIKRGLPDYSVGKVTFDRNAGNEPIVIPLGTLVATEDSQENPKKVYQTIELKVLSPNQTSVDVSVQAVNRGEDQDTAPETVVVMPRPIPGIKSVINADEIKLIGKRKEKDEELRERAKTVLISSGKANILAIENAVFSLPGVVDVKVQESFHFAKGEIDISRSNTDEVADIPRGTILFFGTGSKKRTYKTLDDLHFETNATTKRVRIQCDQEGPFGELQASAGLSFEAESLQADYMVDNPENIQLGDFGVIEVFVDAPDFHNPDKPEVKSSIQKAINDVRAAGIYVILEAAQRIEVDIVLRIEISPTLNLTPEERTDFEKSVQSALEDFFLEFKLGDTFVFSKLIKNVLNVEGVENLEDFKIQTTKFTPEETIIIPYEFSNNKIQTGENERFAGRYLCVASEDKPLPVNIQFKINDITNLPTIQSAIDGFFQDLQLGQEVKKSSIASTIGETNLVLDSLKISARSWCPRPMLHKEDNEVTIQTSFVEFPVLGELFVYQNKLEIIGAIRITVPDNLLQDEKEAITEQARLAVNEYLESLGAEEEVFFEQMIEAVQKVNQITETTIVEDDFQAFINGLIQPERVTSEKINVELYEKAAIQHLCITSETKKVEVAIPELEVQLRQPLPILEELSEEGNAANQESIIQSIKQAIVHAANTHLLNATPGENIIFANYRTAIDNLVPDYPYQINSFQLQATSVGDQRIQNADLTRPNDIHIRSVELAVIVPVLEETVIVSEG